MPRSRPQPSASARASGVLAAALLAGCAGVAPPGLEMIPAGSAVPGASQAFNVTAPSPGWARVAVGTFGDANAELELFDTESGSSVVFYLHRDGKLDLEGVVAARRQALAAHGEITGIVERRRFFDESHFPLSSAQYTLRVEGKSDTARALVDTLRVPAGVIEMIALRRGASGAERVQALRLSITP